jgi:hypothetical protein
MLTLPRAGVFVAICTCLAITIAILVVPASLFWAYAAPERFLTGVREFVGPAYVSDGPIESRTPPSEVIAWRRLAAARDTAAFTRLLAARSPAARLYGLAGLRLFGLASAEQGAKRLEGDADTVDVNWACAERRLALSSAVRELDTSGWADSLRSARAGCS